VKYTTYKLKYGRSTSYRGWALAYWCPCLNISRSSARILVMSQFPQFTAFRVLVVSIS